MAVNAAAAAAPAAAPAVDLKSLEASNNAALATQIKMNELNQQYTLANELTNSAKRAWDKVKG